MEFSATNIDMRSKKIIRVPLPHWLVFMLMIISMAGLIFFLIDLEKRFTVEKSILYWMGMVVCGGMTGLTTVTLFSGRTIFSDSLLYKTKEEQPDRGFINVQIKFDEFGFTDSRIGQNIPWSSIGKIWIARTDTFYMDKLTVFIQVDEQQLYNISESNPEFMGLYEKLVGHFSMVNWSDLMYLSGAKEADLPMMLFQKER
jgi:hypothetical protein